MGYVSEYLIRIIKAALTDYKLKCPKEEFDWNELLRLSQKHKITALVGTTLLSEKIELPEQIKQSFLKDINKNILLDTMQENERRKLSQAFEKENLNYMLMKGYNLKKLYPESYMRYMCDIDILIDNEIYEKYESVMLKLNYEKQTESDHEHIFTKKSIINIELHKSIVPTYYKDLYNYYGNGWKYAQSPEGSSRYEYSLENQYVFLIVHLAKHYQGSGIGISHFIDIYVMNNKCSYDKVYVQTELEKLGLVKFHTNVLQLLDYWFCDKQPDKSILDMNEYVISGGAYGSMKNHLATETMLGIEKYGNEKSARRAKRLEVIFPTVKRLAEEFLILDKYPVLYPVFLVYRNVRAVLFRRNKVKNYMSTINYKNDEYVKELSSHLHDVGLKKDEKWSDF